MALARVAGFTYLFYIVIGVSNEILMHRAIPDNRFPADLGRIAAHATDVRIAILLSLLESVSAITLGVALYGITRRQGHELAILGMVCRVAEGVIGSMSISGDTGLLWLLSERAGLGNLDVNTTNALSTSLLLPGGSVGAIFFAMGSLVFSYLMLRGRMIPKPLAHLGVWSSAVLVVGLPLQVAGFFIGPLTGVQWLPAIAFAISLGLWLLIKGVASPSPVNNESAAR